MTPNARSRPIFSTAARGLLLSVALVPAASAQLEAAPNVIVVLVDDLGWTDLSCTGSKFYETPNIDRLAAAGMTFTNAYAAAAICSPTRAAVMTGRAPARVGITDWIRARFQGGTLPPDNRPVSGYAAGGNRFGLRCPKNPLWLPHEEVTIAEELTSSGYVCGHIGKWHLGPDDWYPEHQGFAFNAGGCDYGQPPSYFDPYANKRLDGIPTLKPRQAGEYLTDREGAEAESFVRTNAERRFFLHYAPYAVHTPIQARKDLIQRYREKPVTTEQKNAKDAAMIHSLDAAVGRILKTLDELELTDKTLMIFTSDNGGLVGPTHNAPLRNGKGSPYEGGVRVPFLVRWPGVVEPGTVSDEPVISMDLLPTIVEATGAARTQTPELDGTSLIEHLRSSGRTPLAPRALFWHFPHNRYGRVGPYSIVRDGTWKLIRWWDGLKHELYDLESDLGEQTDLATAQPDKVADLAAKLDDWLASTDARLPVAWQQDKQAPWQDLFDGETLEGWRPLGGKAEYQVEDGVIVGTSVPNTRNTFLCTEQVYGDFELELEFKVDDGLNSGVQIRSNSLPGYRKGVVHGYQVEIDPSKRAWSTGIYDESRRGWLDDLADNEPARNAFKSGAWNRVRVLCVGDSLKTWLNGVPAADLVDSMTQTGFIGLQVHGVGKSTDRKQIRWRKIRLRDLGRHVWRPLLNGKTLEGWHKTPGGTWKVEKGRVVGSCEKSEKRHGILLTDERFGDFTARVRYRVVQGNSGFYFRVDPVDSAVGVHGFQAEMDAMRDAGMLYETGGRARVSVPDAALVKKHFMPGKWNEMTVSAHAGHIVVRVNGHRMSELRDDPGRREGHLGIQLHGNQDMRVEVERVDVLVPQR